MNAGMSWYRLGLRGRLFMAFGVVAALTVLASGSAIISYDSLGRSLGAISEKSLPEITRASEVARAAGNVAAAAPRLLAATDQAERDHASGILTAARQELKQSIGALAADDVAKVSKTADRILVNLDRLIQSVTERRTIATARNALVASLRNRIEARRKLAPMADDAGFSLTMGLRDCGGQQGYGSRSEDVVGAGRQRTGVAAGHSGVARGIQPDVGNLGGGGRPAVRRSAAAGRGPLHGDRGPAWQGGDGLQEIQRRRNLSMSWSRPARMPAIFSS
ncbi:hypothetical protein ACF1BQ_045005 [Bradyrhizobium sp. RDT10]